LQSNAFSLVATLNLAWLFLCEWLHVPDMVGGSLAGVAITVVPCLLSLIFYRLILTSGKKRPSARQIDSIYYLGFLITLMVLGAAAFELSMNLEDLSEGLVQSIGSKFALGLLVTGLGLYFRIALQSEVATDVDALSALKQYADSIGVVNDRILETDRVLSNAVENVVKIAKTSAQDAGKEFSNLIVGELAPAVAELKSSISQMVRVLDRFKPERFAGVTEVTEKLANRFRDLEEIAPALSRNLSQLSANVSQLATSSETLSQRAGAASTALASATVEASKLEGTIAPLSSGTLALASAFGSAKESLSPLEDTFTQVNAAGVNLEARLGSAAQALNSAKDAAQKFGGSIADISIKGLVEDLSQAQLGIAGLAKGLATLSEVVQNSRSALALVVDESASSLKQRVSEMEEATTALGQAMTALAMEIKAAAEEANK
jgi:hypothetical protein